MTDNERFCEHCGMRIVPLSVLIRDPWAGCTGVRELQVDPYMSEIEDDHTEVWLCPGSYQIRADDI